MVTIYFEPHGTTPDNEDKVSSGWYDVELSQLGIAQAKELGERYANQTFAAIFCSDLIRSYRTAEIAFNGIYPVIQDARLRECNYGDMTRASKERVEEYKDTALTVPYPHGESYEDTSRRMKAFLEDLSKNYDDKTVMIIGHRATQYGLEQWINGVSLKDAVLAPWRWQPGWKYELHSEMLV